MKHILILGCLFVFFVPAWAQKTIFETPLSPRIANYDMEVSFDTETKILTGKEVLHWTNPSQDTISELQFHLYLNAFKNTNSTFMRESGGQLRGVTIDKKSKENVWGYIDVQKMQVQGGADLTSNMRFIQTDDNNKDDQSVMAVTLDEPLLPGQSIDLEIDFISKLPKIFARTGYAGDYALVAQWFPKIAVYETPGQRYIPKDAKKGAWNCHQFHANSEFYADYGVYNVKMTVPENYVVGASGQLEEVKDNGDGTKTHFYHAEDVIDFAWTLSPHFKVFERDWKHVNIRLLIQPEHLEHVERHFHSAEAGLAYFAENLGEYPYNTLTIVDPPFIGLGSAGMEYPTFMTAGSVWKMPEGARFIETVTIHEFGHQYFMGILGSNEFEEPWLDEGFNQYFETRVMDDTYGEKHSATDLFGYHSGDLEQARIGYVGMSNPKIAENFRPAWGFSHGGYGSLTYRKTATWMTTLDRMVGRETMNQIMKTYYKRWRFKHPCATDFIDVVNEVVSKKYVIQEGKLQRIDQVLSNQSVTEDPESQKEEVMNWFFEQVLYGSDLCDYKLASIQNVKQKAPQGVYDTENGEKRDFKDDEKDSEEEGQEDEEAEKEEKIYDSKVIIHRLGEVIVPVEVLIHFENGDEVKELWSGQERSFEFAYTRPEKILWAKLDPENKILIDANLNNNSLTLKPKKTAFMKYSVKFMFWVQNLMQFFANFI